MEQKKQTNKQERNQLNI